jgi:hypothetical protein
MEDIYWNKLKKKVHLFGSYYGNLSCNVKKDRESTLKWKVPLISRV